MDKDIIIRKNEDNEIAKKIKKYYKTADLMFGIFLTLLVLLHIACICLFVDNDSLPYRELWAVGSLIAMLIFPVLYFSVRTIFYKVFVCNFQYKITIQDYDTQNRPSENGSVYTGSYYVPPKVEQQFIGYINANAKKLGLFMKPFLKKEHLLLANKFVVINIDLRSLINGICRMSVIDKPNGEEYNIEFLLTAKQGTTESEEIFNLFVNLCDSFDYETNSEKVFSTLNIDAHIYEQRVSKKKKFYLDINQASEAELTALPGVTIAKAKHAIKVRNKQKLFLTMNQFYEAINLEEEFIEQIQTKGNKILLNELPEYKKLEIKRED